MYVYNIHMYANNIQFTKVEILILKFVFKHFRDKYNARQLARTLSLNHAHVNKLCNNLAHKKLLKKEEIGNSIYYTFDYGNDLAIKFVEYLLSLERNESPKWLKVVAYNMDKFREHIDLGIIFGSSIKSDKFNDIDILLVYDKKKKTTIKKIKDDIRRAELIEKPIRYVEMTEKDILNNKNKEVIYNILSENIIFHNSAKYIKVIKKCSKS